MKIYTLEKEITLPMELHEAWEFFSSPNNLSKITPPHMGFNIKYKSGGEKMYPGQLIIYKLQPIKGITMQWVTEITQVKEPNYFVDEQKFGPYAMWHHQHHFKESKDGVKVIDILNYALPLSALGRIANGIFVKKEVQSIFEYRSKMLEKMFKK